MKYRDPAEIGADRMADLAALLADYAPPAIVVDLGTTTNFEVVDAEGVFLGGIIAPGMALGARSLAARAAMNVALFEGYFQALFNFYDFFITVVATV